MRLNRTAAAVCTVALALAIPAGLTGCKGNKPVQAANSQAAAPSPAPTAAASPRGTQASVTVPVALPSFDATTDPFVIEDKMRAIIALMAKNTAGNIPDDLRHPEIQSVGLEVCGVNGVWPAATCQEGNADTPTGTYRLYISVESARKQFNLGGHNMPGVYDSLVTAYATYIADRQAQRVNPKLMITLDGLTDAEKAQRTKLIVCTYGAVLGGMRNAHSPLPDVEQAHANLINSTFYNEGADGKACI